MRGVLLDRRVMADERLQGINGSLNPVPILVQRNTPRNIRRMADSLNNDAYVYASASIDLLQLRAAMQCQSDQQVQTRGQRPPAEPLCRAARK